MKTDRTPAINEQQRRKGNSQFKEAWLRLKKNKLAVAALVVLCLVILTAIFADFIVDYKTKVIEPNYGAVNQSFSLEHPFGTDAYGRDILARVIHGTRYSLLMGFVGTAVATLLACIIGSSAALIGGWLDSLVTRIVDVLMTIPNVLFAMAIVAGLGIGIPQLIAALTITQTVTQTRVVRSAVLNVADQEYIESARALGASTPRIIRKYVLPNVIGTILVQSTISVAHNVLLGATLSFLGLGAKPPIPEWGAMLSEAISNMRYYPHEIIGPGIALVIMALSISIFGDALRDAVDPKLKGRA